LAWTTGPIVVTSDASVEGGRANWGIPKHRAAFKIAEGTLGTSATIFDEETKSVFGDLLIESRGPRIPASSGLLPAMMTRLAQVRDGKRFEFNPRTRGRVRLARVRRLATSDPFPSLNRTHVRMALELEDFDMVFPEAQIEAA